MHRHAEHYIIRLQVKGAEKTLMLHGQISEEILPATNKHVLLDIQPVDLIDLQLSTKTKNSNYNINMSRYFLVSIDEEGWTDILISR